MTIVTFISKTPSLTIKLHRDDQKKSGEEGKLISFQNGALYFDTEDEEQRLDLEQLRKDLKKNPHSSQMINEVDPEIARRNIEKFERENLRQHRSATGMFHTGSTQSQSTELTRSAVEDRVRSQGGGDAEVAAAIEALAQDGLVVAENTAEVARIPREGFQPLSGGKVEAVEASAQTVAFVMPKTA